MKKIFFTLYALTIIALVLFSYAFIDQNVPVYKNVYSGFATQNREFTTIIYLIFIILLFTWYLFFLYRFRGKSGMTGKKDVWIVIGITCLLVFSYPAMLSFDIFNYMTTAKVLFFYHENPYIIMPIDFVGDPFLLYTHAANKIALYGPGWLIATAIPHFLGLGNFLLTVFSFKIIAVVSYLLITLLIWQLSKSTVSLVLFSLNPLVIFETLVSSHNDIFMMVLVLASFLFIKKKQYIRAICLFVLSIAIKYATLFLLPVFVWILWNAYQQKEIHWKKVYYYSFIAMVAIFLLSPLREEMYPWYAIWFLPFIALMPERKGLLYIAIAFSFGLLLRYVPFMYSGTHFGVTPVLRILLAGVPVVVVGILRLKK